MDYSLLLGVHYRAPQHLRPNISYNRGMTTDGLGILAEEGRQYMPDALLSALIGCLDLQRIFSNHLQVFFALHCIG